MHESHLPRKENATPIHTNEILNYLAQKKIEKKLFAEKNTKELTNERKAH
jgi:hypothetical protein